MPRIPFSQPRVGLATGQSGRFQGGGVVPVQDASGQQAQQFGEQVERTGIAEVRIAADLQDQIDVSRIKAGASMLSERYRKVLQDPRGGYLNTVGRTAVDGRKAVLDALQREREAVTGTLSNDRQRALFGPIAADASSDAMSRIDRHYVESVRSEAYGAAVARAGAYHADALDAHPESQNFAVALGGLHAEIDEAAELKGFAKDSPQREQMHREAITKLHSQKLDVLIAQGDASAAQDYLKTYGKEIEPEVRGQVQGQVKKAGVDVRAQSLVQDFDRLGVNFLDGRKRLDEMLAANKIGIDLHDETLRRWRVYDSEKYQFEQQHGKSVLDDAQKTLQLKQPLSPKQLHDLRTTGRDKDLQVWIEQGGQWITTAAGMRIMRTMTPAILRNTKTQDELENTLRPHLNDKDMSAMVEEWRRVTKPGDDASTINPNQLMFQGFRTTQVNGITTKLIIEDITGDNARHKRALAQAWDDWTIAVQRRVNLNVKDRKANSQDYMDAMQQLKADSLRFGERTVPRVLATEDERKEGIVRTELHGDIDLNLFPPEEIQAQIDAHRALGEDESNVTLATIAEELAYDRDQKNAALAAERAADKARGIEMALQYYRVQSHSLQADATERRARLQTVFGRDPGQKLTTDAEVIGQVEQVIETYGEQLRGFGLTNEEIRNALLTPDQRFRQVFGSSISGPYGPNGFGR